GASAAARDRRRSSRARGRAPPSPRDPACRRRRGGARPSSDGNGSGGSARADSTGDGRDSSSTGVDEGRVGPDPIGGAQNAPLGPVLPSVQEASIPGSTARPLRGGLPTMRADHDLLL